MRALQALRKDVLSDLNISMWIKLYRSSPEENTLSTILGGQSPPVSTPHSLIEPRPS
jgi:hypothetical protein